MDYCRCCGVWLTPDINLTKNTTTHTPHTMSDIDEDLLALAGGNDQESGDSDYEPTLIEDKTEREVSAGEQNPYPLEGKYKDADDRAKLLGMDEMTRESLLFDRSQEMEKYNEKKYLALRAKQNKIDESITGRGAVKTNKLSELKRQREMRHKRQKTDSYEPESQDEAYYGKEEEEEEEGYDDYVEEDDAKVEWATSKSSTLSQPASVSDLNKIRVGRTMLGKFCFYPEFDSVIVGTYTKMNIGPSKSSGVNQYRMCRIEGVTTRDQKYKLHGHMVNFYCTISQGSSKRSVQMSFLSDEPFTQQEFEIYTKRLEKDDISLPNLKKVDLKFHELKAMSSKSLTDNEITEMINKKQSVDADLKGVNLIVRKTTLQQERQIAIQNEDFAKAEKVDAQLAKMDKEVANVSNSYESKMSKINDRNVRVNQDQIRKAEILATAKRRQMLLDNKANGDPFSRLRTTTKMFYTSLAEVKPEDVVKTEVSAEEDQERQKMLFSCEYRLLGMDKLIGGVDLDLSV